MPTTARAFWPGLSQHADRAPHAQATSRGSIAEARSIVPRVRSSLAEPELPDEAGRSRRVQERIGVELGKIRRLYEARPRAITGASRDSCPTTSTVVPAGLKPAQVEPSNQLSEPRDRDVAVRTAAVDRETF